MSAQDMFQREEDGDFGPGTALVLSLFAVLLLVAAMGWQDTIKNRGMLPKRIIAIGEGGQSLFKAGRSDLSLEAQQKITQVVRDAVDTVRRQRRANEQTSNHLQVIGYASPEGKQNPQLAEQRAASVRDFLVKRLGVSDECVVVASYSDSHSAILRKWLDKGNSLAKFRRLIPREQRTALGTTDDDLAKERRVEILSVYHSDSTCRLDLVTIRP